MSVKIVANHLHNERKGPYVFVNSNKSKVGHYMIPTATLCTGNRMMNSFSFIESCKTLLLRT